MRYILGTRVDTELNKDAFLRKLSDVIKSDTYGNIISTTNPEFLVNAQNDAEFKNIINSSSMSLADGVGVFFAERLYSVASEIKHTRKNVSFLSWTYTFLKTSFNFAVSRGANYERLRGREVIYDMCSQAAQNNWNVFFLGGWELDMFGRRKPTSGEVARKTSEKILEMFPNLCVVGATSEFSHKSTSDDDTCTYIKKCMSEKKVDRIDMMFVAFGQPSQEKWLVRNAKKLNVKVGIGVGGTFDFISGVSPVAPAFFSNNKIEWLYRLITQPYRFKRIFNAVIVFPVYILLDTFSYINKK